MSETASIPTMLRQRAGNVISLPVREKPLAVLREAIAEQKARAALVLSESLNVTGGTRIDLFKSLVVDLIQLVPTLIDERGRSVTPGGDAECAA